MRRLHARAGKVATALSALAITLTLAACEKADNAPGPGGVTVGEARALDEAAQMLDARRPPAELFRPSASLTPPAEADSGTPVKP